ncbi:MAG: DUF721 domain-containing protein [Candidatus Polarisedimenticolia bacterium]
MGRWASVGAAGRSRLRRSAEFCGLNEIAVADRAAGENGLDAGRLRMLRLQTAWARAVGAPLKEVARLRACAGQRLVVDVPDALWKREMERMTPRILERLAREVPCAPVTELSFSVRGGPARRAASAVPSLPARVVAGVDAPDAALAGLPDSLCSILEQVEDESLRGHLKLVMGRYLSRRAPSR